MGNGRVAQVGQRDSILDAISGMAQNHGIAVLPDGRDWAGRAVFKIGGVRIIIDGSRQVVMLLMDSNAGPIMRPIALTELMQLATS
eukprot:IDg15196t1